jgi:putative transposase
VKHYAHLDRHVPGLLCKMIGFAAHLMELDVWGLTGAAHGARYPECINQRNGYRDRLW